MASEYDWEALKAEYITTNISYRDMSKKYGIPRTTLNHQGKKGQWVKARAQHRANIVANSVEAVENDASKYKSKVYELAYETAVQMQDLIKSNTIESLLPMGVKPRDITGALKDLCDIYGIKSAADIEEQKARIAKIRKDAEQIENKDNKIIVTFEDSTEEWGK